jgi:hypothetical protein
MQQPAIVSLSEIISGMGDRLLIQQRDDGSFPPSRNGAVDESLTPVRSTANCLKILLQAYQTTDDQRFLDAFNHGLDFLHSKSARPCGYTFHCREVSGKDRCNGLMGQCHPLTTLSMADDQQNEDRHQKLASEVFLIHPYDDEVGLWQPVEIDGTTLPFDRTFNHQLWFAAAGSHFRSIPAIDERVQGFLNHLETNLRTDDGLIAHRLRPNFSLNQYFRHLVHPTHRTLLRNQVLHYLRPPASRARLRKKAVHYQSINLFALSFLKKAYPEHNVWDAPKIDNAIEYVRRESYRRRMKEEGFIDKPTGLQNAVALHRFEKGTEEECRWWVREQLRRSYDPKTGCLGRGSVDSRLMASSIYMAGYLPEMKFRRDDILPE